MATIAVAAGDIAAHKVTLSANTVDTVTFADDVNVLEIISDGTDDLYVRLDGTNPTVAGAKSYRLPGGVVSTREVQIPEFWASQAGGVVVKLISAGATKYSLTKIR